MVRCIALAGYPSSSSSGLISIAYSVAMPSTSIALMHSIRSYIAGTLSARRRSLGSKTNMRRAIIVIVASSTFAALGIIAAKLDQPGWSPLACAMIGSVWGATLGAWATRGVVD
jgi:hypothetical protein